LGTSFLIACILGAGTEITIPITRCGHWDQKRSSRQKIPTRQPSGDVPEHLELLAEFPSGLTLVVAASTVNAKSPALSFTGTKLARIGPRESVTLLPEKEYAMTLISRDFPDSVRSKILPCTRRIGSIHPRQQAPKANIDLAVRVQTVISLAEMSDRLKVACLFDEKTGK